MLFLNSLGISAHLILRENVMDIEILLRKNMHIMLKDMYPSAHLPHNDLILIGVRLVLHACCKYNNFCGSVIEAADSRGL